jgi:hypothetical protein
MSEPPAMSFGLAPQTDRFRPKMRKMLELIGRRASFLRCDIG